MTAQNLVHEADSQRHHVRVKLPAKMELNGEFYDIEDWSTAGAKVILSEKKAESVLPAGKPHDVRMVFELEGFTLVVPMRVESRHESGGDKDKTIGVRYVDMTQEQVVIMQQLVGSYVTGELSSVGDLIHVVSRNNFTKPRQIPQKANMTQREKMIDYARKGAVALVSLLLFSYVALSIFEYNFVVTADRAFVTADAIAVTSPSGGIVNFKKVHNGDKVSKGDVLATIQSDTGNVVGVDSPCDCIIQEIRTVSGAETNRGSVLMRMTALDSPLYIQALVNFENATKLRRGQNVTVRLADSKNIAAEISSIAVKTEGSLTSVLVKPKEEVPSDLLGLPVEVKVNTFAAMR